MRPRRVGAAIGLAGLIFLSIAPPAQAGRKEGGYTDGQSLVAEVIFERVAAPKSTAGKSNGTGPTCRYSPLPEDLVALADDMAAVGYVDPKGDFDGVWYRKECTDSGLSTLTVAWRKPPSLRAPIDSSGLAEQALQSAPIPLPGIGMNPPADREQVVGLPVFLWMDPASWKPVSASASAAGTTVTVEATPVQVIWSMGNGDSVTCGAGTPYDSSQHGNSTTDCSYTYPHSSDGQPSGQFRLTASTEWRARWRSTSGASGDLGTVTRTSTTLIRVTELQAINTGPSS